MKKLILIGNLTSNAEQKVIGSGKTVTSFSLAINERTGNNNSTLFIKCSTWREMGNVIQYLKKGTKLSVIGDLSVRKYQDNQGIEKTSVECLFNEFEILNWVKNESKTNENQGPFVSDIPDPF